MNEMLGHSRPTINEDDIRAVRRVLQSGWIAQGEEVRGLEEDLAEAVGVADGVCVNSGTAALHLALLALGVGEGDEVVIPGYCCSSVLHAVRLAGGRPIVADVDPVRLVMDEGDLRRKSRNNAKALVYVHLLGYPGPVAAALDLGPPVVEDCAQALGAEIDGKAAGSFGIMSVFSFYATKLITTGEGGMVLSEDVDLLSKVGHLRSSRTNGNGTAYSYMMSDIQAALGRSQLKRLDSFLEKRKKLFETYQRELKDMPLRLIDAGENTAPARYRFVVELETGDVGSVIDSMETAGVQCRRPFEEPIFLLTGDNGLPGCREAHDRLLSLPVYPSLGVKDVRRVAGELKKILCGSA